MPIFFQNEQMIRLEKIDESDGRYSIVENLLHDSFPENERRDDEEQRYITECNPLFSCLAIQKNNQTCGLLTFWNFGDFRYIEHFAISSSYRNQGIGANVLKDFIHQDAAPVVLEVEKPTDHFSKRRIEFYKRLGFYLWEEIDYVQPPYRKNGEGVPMLLMSTAGLSPRTDFQKINSILRSQVYQQKD